MQHIGSTLNFGARFKEQQSAYTPDYFRERLPQVRALGVDDQTVRAGAILLLDLLKQERVCGSCKGFDQCGKEGDAKGHYDMLDVYNGQLTVRTTHCNEYLKFVERREIDNLKEFSEKTQEDKRYRFDNYPVEQARKHPKLYAAAMEFAEAFTTGRQNLSDAQKGLYIFGPPGVGKTHLAQSIGYEAIKQGFVVRYRSIFDLVADFLSEEALAKRDRLLRGYLKPDLLIIDDMGLKQLPKHAGEYLLEVIMRRYETRSTIMTSNRPLEDWGKLLQDVPTAGAILDRFLHHAQVIAITGKSYRLKNAAVAAPTKQTEELK